MPRLRSSLAAAVAVLLLAACSGDGEPAPAASPQVTSIAPEPAATAVPASPTPEPTAEPSPEPTPEPPPRPAPTPPPAPAQQQPAPTAAPSAPAPSAPVTLRISARNLVFDRASITVPANTTITVHFTNEDTGVPHDFGVSIPFVPHTMTCNGPCVDTLVFNSGPPASHTFQCSVHPDMVGSFTVQ